MPCLVITLAIRAFPFCTCAITCSVIFICTVATLLFPFAECCSMAELMALVTLGKEVLWCIHCCLVAEFVDEETESNAVVCTYWVVSEHNNRMVLCLAGAWVFLSFSSKGDNLGDFDAPHLIVFFPFFNYFIVIHSQVNGAFCYSVNDNAIPRFVGFEPFVCFAPVDIMQFTNFFNGFELQAYLV